MRAVLRGAVVEAGLRAKLSGRRYGLRFLLMSRRLVEVEAVARRVLGVVIGQPVQVDVEARWRMEVVEAHLEEQDSTMLVEGGEAQAAEAMVTGLLLQMAFVMPEAGSEVSCLQAEVVSACEVECPESFVCWLRSLAVDCSSMLRRLEEPAQLRRVVMVVLLQEV